MKSTKRRRFPAFRPNLFLLEDRTYPGQTPGVAGLVLGSWGLSFLDQALLTFPLDINLDNLYRFQPVPQNAAINDSPSAHRWQTLLYFTPGSLVTTGSQTPVWEPPPQVREHQTVSPTWPASTTSPPLQPAGTLLADALGSAVPNPLVTDATTPPHSYPLIPRQTNSSPDSANFSASNFSADVPAASAVPNPSAMQAGYLAFPATMSPRDYSQNWLDGFRGFLNSAATPPSNPPPLAAIPTKPPEDSTTPLSLPGDQQGGPSGPDDPPGPGSNQRRWEQFQNQPLRFEANLGQRDPRVQFHSRGQGYDLFLTSTEMVLALNRPNQQAPQLPPRPGDPPPPPRDMFALRMQLVGANPLAQLTGQHQLAGVSNFLIGNDRTQWRTNVPNYSRVAYSNVYPGIDMLYYGTNARQLEYDFTVNPGANPALIQLAFLGPSSVSLDPQANLVLPTTFGNVLEHAPIIY